MPTDHSATWECCLRCRNSEGDLLGLNLDRCELAPEDGCSLVNPPWKNHFQKDTLGHGATIPIAHAGGLTQVCKRLLRAHSGHYLFPFASAVLIVVHLRSAEGAPSMRLVISELKLVFGRSLWNLSKPSGSQNHAAIVDCGAHAPLRW